MWHCAIEERKEMNMVKIYILPVEGDRLSTDNRSCHALAFLGLHRMLDVPAYQYLLGLLMLNISFPGYKSQ